MREVSWPALRLSDRADKLVAVAILVLAIGVWAWRAWHVPAPGTSNTPAPAAQTAVGLDYKTLVRDESFHLLLGMAYADAGLIEQALAEEREALRINPRSTAALNNIGYYSLQKGDYRVAINTLEQALQVDPSMQLARNNLVVAYTKAIEMEKDATAREVLRLRLAAAQKR